MNPSHRAAAPAWPPIVESYDYLSSLVARDWAWEGLRRNGSYQAEARAHAATANVTEHLEGRALVTRMAKWEGKGLWPRQEAVRFRQPVRARSSSVERRPPKLRRRGFNSLLARHRAWTFMIATPICSQGIASTRLPWLNWPRRQNEPRRVRVPAASP
jgi:transcriptional regulator